ncbi:MAG: hypothetical protein H0T79_20925, partial [Deltaproteobacteria bacterium]|nr:hypothetical protein [Deltaproteobacteria bacterium]
MVGGEAGVHIHAVDASGAYLTRATTDAAGAFHVTVPQAADVKLVAFRRGDAVIEEAVGTGSSATITLPATGRIRVAVTEDTVRLPVRVQIRPGAGQTIPKVPK